MRDSGFGIQDSEYVMRDSSSRIRVSGCAYEGFEFRVSGFGVRDALGIRDARTRDSGFGFRVQGFRLPILEVISVMCSGSRFWFQGWGLRVQGEGFGVQGLEGGVL